jgi:hypothetical protein
MEVTYRMTREDCHHLAGLVWTRVVEQAGRVSGWRANPAVLSAGSILLTLLLLADRADGIAVPKGAFANEEARERFVAIIREQIARASA